MRSSVLTTLKTYAEHPDPRVALGNFIALLVASNQPFYPLYIWWLVSDQFWPSLFTLLSTPFFLAVPAVARRNSIAGRALLPLTGIANTVHCAYLFGVESGVEMFLLPCGVLALLLFRPGERLISYAVSLSAFLAYFGLHGAYGAPAVSYSVDEYAAFMRLNVVSATVLTACSALLFSNLLAQSEETANLSRDQTSD